MKAVSVFDIFKIGIGPSSSHTVGPMLAAQHFALNILGDQYDKVVSIKVHLYGSLSLTGVGHGTDRAIICGLEGNSPESVDTEIFSNCLERVGLEKGINLSGKKIVRGEIKDFIEFHATSLSLHPNGMKIVAKLSNSEQEIFKIYYSIGGGFISDEAGVALTFSKSFPDVIPYPFKSAAELLAICKTENRTIAEIVFSNERTIRSESEIADGLSKIWETMNSCIEKGSITTGTLPGGLGVKRRAAAMLSQLQDSKSQSILNQLDYLSSYALAVNEENAAFGRVVTAPTNGAAGVIPAVFKFYLNQMGGDITFLPKYLLTATAMAFLFKSGASLSAAEMGCQGEIGVAASMAAAGLTALQGGNALQVENAAEIAIEHSLGLTCDPVAGLVQIPCIERNAIGAAKAVTAAQLALKSDGTHIVSLDQAILAMKKTGIDMHSKYKETSTGGLAISVAAPEC